jgi:hypothetical protein
MSIDELVAIDPVTAREAFACYGPLSFGRHLLNILED